MEMGNLGQPRKKGDVQRGRKNVRRRDERSSGIHYYPDVYIRVGSAARKRGVDRWLATSMFISFPPMSAEREAKVVDDSASAIKGMLDTISGSQSVVDVKAPSDNDPSWIIDAEVEINGVMQELFIASIDLNEAMSGAMLWANGISK